MMGQKNQPIFDPSFHDGSVEYNNFKRTNSKFNI